jgi:ABC-type lipoprotein release transport system permease subunit
MRSIGLLFRAEWRRRRAAWIALAVLVSIIGATVLVGASAAQRTSSAFPQYLARYSYDAQVTGFKPFPKKFFHLPGVESIALSTYYFNGNVIAGGHFAPAGDVNVMALPSTGLDRTIKLLWGTFPDAANEALVGYSMQQQYGLHVGSIVTVPFYSLAQRNAVIDDNEPPPARGLRERFRVVGIEASVVDFPTTTPSYSIFTGNAFGRGLGRSVAAANFAFVRLRAGQEGMPKFQYAANHMTKQLGEFYAEDVDASTAAIENSIHPQAEGWWLFALFALLAGLALVGQSLIRQSLIEKESYPTLSALGMGPNQLWGLGMLRAIAIAIAGAVGAVIIAFVLSPLTPEGVARAAENQRGFVFDGPVFVLGALGVVAAVLLLALWPTWRASQVHADRVRGDQLVTSHAAVGAAVARTGAPPSVLIGVRNALERGRGRSSVPVATALLGTVMAVAALVAATIFGASLTNLLTTPRLYGENWQVSFDGVTTKQLHHVLATLEANLAVTGVTYGGVGKYLQVGDVAVQSVYVTVAKGPMVFSLVSGHHPTGAGQIDLGQTVLKQAKLHVGSRVEVTVVNTKGVSRRQVFRVVGTVAIPPILGIGGLGNGAVISIHALEVLACGRGPAQSTCANEVSQKIATDNDWGVLVAVRPGLKGRATVAGLERKYAADLDVPIRPTNLVNFGQAVDFPLLLEATLVLFGAAALAHVLIVSVTRRRRQFALLKVLGFVHHQVRTAMCWQAATVAGVGVVVGVPVGLVLGQVIWRDFASALGAVPLAVVPAVIVLIVAVATLVGAVVLALGPATLAARVRPAEALREA